MVKPWDLAIDKGIALTKFRIKHHEKHGCGLNIIEDKNILKKQERHKEVRNQKQ